MKIKIFTDTFACRITDVNDRARVDGQKKKKTLHLPTSDGGHKNVSVR